MLSLQAWQIFQQHQQNAEESGPYMPDLTSVLKFGASNYSNEYIKVQPTEISL